METMTIGVDLGMTSASDVAVAEGATVTGTRKVASTREALTAAFAKWGGSGPVNVVVESTAMAWFVAAVAVLRAGIDATVFWVPGTKAAALRRFYREHTKTDRIDARVLERMPLVDDGLHEPQVTSSWQPPGPFRLANELQGKRVHSQCPDRQKRRSTIKRGSERAHSSREGALTEEAHRARCIDRFYPSRVAVTGDE